MATQKLYSLLPYSLYRKLDIKGGDIASKLEAGLPNITGSITASVDSGPIRGNGNISGAFTLTSNNRGLRGEEDITGCGFAFDASRSNSIYGNADTVQPPAIQLIPQIKY